MTVRVASLAAAILLIGASHALADELTGASAPLGEGTLTSYAELSEDGAPVEIGVVFSAGAFEGLPMEPSQTGRCYDLDGDGSVGHDECEGDYQRDLLLPGEVREHPDVPFEFSMVNWNPHGHDPDVWSVPHFDVHFYMIPPAEVKEIELGECGYFMDCEDFERATKPVPEKYVHPDFADVGAAVGQMGNHLIDTKTPEMADSGTPFTHTWIFGAFDGRITFYETMATREFLATTEDVCTDIKQPEAWERAGYYPTRYCFARNADGALRAYLTDFVTREAG